ncbi:molybdenum ABC transporter ATP-binding protein [Veronia nyctiphanis]|uniref:Molybdenum ABC transporter ATP-binding protein n=1 Tax=Veronia nyctiphanis TaxID=1278244 RepID=A0A4Q0YRY0_9GAMM|nr:molybdenum ABC transporter ATP-binding protein ModC [Veronia nyctiphanis]RXJ73912.1 molybdenum ABC transporter ATP-binding protein [Veronia nyctiphanis]
MLNIDIAKQLGDIRLEVNAALPEKGVIAVFGRSGAGKTSLVNMLGGLSSPDAGQIFLNGRCLFKLGEKDLPIEKRRIGYVFQEARLFPHYSVSGNLRYGTRGSKPQHFEQIVELLGITSLLSRYPATLSGGEKQRVAIGRALLTSPDILLMDEPLASLDTPRKRELLPYLQSLAQTLAIPIIYVSHSLDEILQLADHMLVLEQGKVIAQGALTDVWNSEEMRPWLPTKDLSTVMIATVDGTHPDYPMTRLKLSNGSVLWVSGTLLEQDADSSQNQIQLHQVRVRINASHVSLSREKPLRSSIRNQLQGCIKEFHISEEGNQVQVKISAGQDELWANITPWAFDELELAVGVEVYAQIKGVSMTQADLAQSH